MLDRETLASLGIHLIYESYATHKHANVKARIAKRKRFHVHFTQTCASWLNQVERWFSLLSRRAIKRSRFNSVTELNQRIQAFPRRATDPRSRSSGWRQPIRSSKNSRDHAIRVTGHHASRCWRPFQFAASRSAM